MSQPRCDADTTYLRDDCFRQAETVLPPNARAKLQRNLIRVCGAAANNSIAPLSASAFVSARGRAAHYAVSRHPPDVPTIISLTRARAATAAPQFPFSPQAERSRLAIPNDSLERFGPGRACSRRTTLTKAKPGRRTCDTSSSTMPRSRTALSTASPSVVVVGALTP